MDITMHCNACKTVVTQKDDLKGYSTAGFNLMAL